MAMIAPPTANPTLIFAGRANCSTAIAARAEAVLPTTADHGWASGELGMANSRNALAPSGAINRKLAMSPRQALSTTSSTALSESASPAPKAARRADRKSVVSGKSVSVRVDLGGRRLIKKKKIPQTIKQQTNNTH